MMQLNTYSLNLRLLKIVILISFNIIKYNDIGEIYTFYRINVKII